MAFFCSRNPTTIDEASRIIKNELLDGEVHYWIPFISLLMDSFTINEKIMNEKIVTHHLNILPAYVLSFSYTNKERQLWYRYSSRGAGSCLEMSKNGIDFWLSHYNKTEKLYEFSVSSRVIYDETEQKSIVTELIRNGYYDYLIKFDARNPKVGSEILKELTFDLMLCSYFFKSNKWANEKEYRIVLVHSKQCRVPNLMTNKPYIEIPFIEYFDSNVFKGEIKSTYALTNVEPNSA